MDLTIDVTWADGQVTRHEIGGLPDLPDDQISEELNMDLASYLAVSYTHLTLPTIYSV